MSRIYTLSELKESKLMYDRKPPAFGVIITFMTLIFVVSAIIWAAFSPKTYVVKATSLLVSQDKVNIMSKVSAPIKEIYVEEGQEVKAGDALIQFDDFQARLQLAQIQSVVDYYQKNISIMDRLVAFINNFTLADQNSQINPFDKDNSDEAKAYLDAQTFIDYVNQQKQAAEEQENEYSQTEVDALKTQLLSQQYSYLNELKMQLAQYQSQLTMYQEALSDFILKAEQSGVVHLIPGLTKGTVLQAGALLGSISSKDSSTYYFETIIPAFDRSKIKINNPVEIAIGGILQSEYGVLKGKVIAIDTDSTQTEKGEVFYRVKIKPDNLKLTDRRGNTINLTLGMIGESRIKYDETTWLIWIIEQIGIKLR